VIYAPQRVFGENSEGVPDGGLGARYQSSRRVGNPSRPSKQATRPHVYA
jgi:hypothetical protein